MQNSQQDLFDEEESKIMEDNAEKEVPKKDESSITVQELDDEILGEHPELKPYFYGERPAVTIRKISKDKPVVEIVDEDIIEASQESNTSQTEPEYDESKNTSPSLLKNKVDIEVELLEKLQLNRPLPQFNTQEKIIIVLDTARDEEETPFIANRKKFNPLEMLRLSLEMFFNWKSNIDGKHEFALMQLTEDSARWIKGFTQNPKDIIKSLGNLKECKPEDIFNLNSVFDCILRQIDVPEWSDKFINKIPPPYTLRVVFIYNRSYTCPELTLNPRIEALLKSPFFTFDVLVTHEPIDDSNNCEKIFEVLQNIDKKGFAYSFFVERSVPKLQGSMAKLLSHPLQRPIQKLASYTFD